jgi:RHS repeat-associated protein
VFLYPERVAQLLPVLFLPLKINPHKNKSRHVLQAGSNKNHDKNKCRRDGVGSGRRRSDVKGPTATWKNIPVMILFFQLKSFQLKIKKLSLIKKSLFKEKCLIRKTCKELIESQKYRVSDNKYLYNGKELQDESLGGVNLDWYDYGSRFLDPQIGRWTTIDLVSELFFSISPYVYCLNNPL